MRVRSILLIVAPLFVLAGLLLVRVESSDQSFYRSRIWLPHQGTGDSYDLIWPYEGPIPGDKVTLDEGRRRVPPKSLCPATFRGKLPCKRSMRLPLIRLANYGRQPWFMRTGFISSCTTMRWP
ncbi:MAG TPA: hypothetical protein VMW58_06725 [Anaerolineae bacterium]|nr:hypothetical protein [Anaerolineae bacterium]